MNASCATSLKNVYVLLKYFSVEKSFRNLKEKREEYFR